MSSKKEGKNALSLSGLGSGMKQPEHFGMKGNTFTILINGKSVEIGKNGRETLLFSRIPLFPPQNQTAITQMHFLFQVSKRYRMRSQQQMMRIGGGSGNYGFPPPLKREKMS